LARRLATRVGEAPAKLTVSSADNITFIVTFEGSGTVEPAADGFSSLKDGVYDLNIDAGKVHLAGLPSVNMAANSTTTFHRLFGDTPTSIGGSTFLSAVVNTGDNFTFRSAFNRTAPDYQAYLDFDGSGLINTGDNFEFRNRFNKTLTWRV
jgi:hypothetical protein